MATSYYQDTTLGKLRRAGGAIAEIARPARSAAEAAQRPSRLKSAIMPAIGAVASNIPGAQMASNVMAGIPTIAGAVSNAAQRVAAGGIMGAGTTNQPSAIQELRRQAAPAVPSAAPAPVAVDPSRVTGVPVGVDPSKVTGVPLSFSAGMGMSPEAMNSIPQATIAPAARTPYGPVDPSKVTGVPLGVDPSKVTGVPLPPPVPSIAGGNFPPPQNPNAPIAGYVAPTAGVSTLQPDGTDAMGVFGGADVRRPDGTMRSFSPEDIARIAADPNAGRFTPPPVAAAPATMADAMRGTGQNRFVLDAQGKSQDPNDIARKEWAAGTAGKNRAVASTLAGQQAGQSRLMAPRLNGRVGETIRLADEGQRMQNNAAMAGMVVNQANKQADRQSKETIAAGQNKARVDAAKASAARPQDAQARAQQVKAYAEAVVAAQAELDAAKAVIAANWFYSSDSEKERVAAAEKRLADAVKRQEDAASMAGAVTNDTPVQVMTQEEYDALPPGTKFIDSTGKQKTKGQSPA